MGIDFGSFSVLHFRRTPRSDRVFEAKDRKSTADLSVRNLRDDKDPSLQSEFSLFSQLQNQLALMPWKYKQHSKKEESKAISFSCELRDELAGNKMFFAL